MFRMCWVEKNIWDILSSFYSFLEECLLRFVSANSICKFVNKSKRVCEVEIANAVVNGILMMHCGREFYIAVVEV